MTEILPGGHGFSPEVQRERFVRVETGFDLTGRKLTLLVPKTWAAIPPPNPAPDAIDALRMVAFWSDGTTPPAPLSLQVFTGRFPREIAAAHYLRRMATAMRFEPLVVEPVSSALADSLVGFQVNLVPFRGRLLIRLYGSMVVATLASGPASRYEEMASLYDFLVRGASIENLTAGGPMEPRRDIALGPRLTCQMPGSWTSEHQAGPDRLRGLTEMTSMAQDGTPIGRLRLKWLANQVAGTPPEELEKLRKEITSAGLTIGPRTRATGAESMLPGKLILKAHDVHLATLGNSGGMLELHRLVVVGRGFTLAITMLNAANQTDFTAWALSRRALEIAVETLRESD